MSCRRESESNGGLPPGQRISHVVVNVTDLERSVAFYEATTTLRVRSRFVAPEQAFGPLGIERAAFEGAAMADGAVEGGPSMLLVRWKGAPAGLTTYGSFTSIGLFRLCFQSAEVERVYADVVAEGGRPFTAPLGPDGQNQKGRPVFSFPDPDGTVIEYVTRPGPTRLYHVNCNCSDLARSSAFYEGALGLIQYERLATTIPVVNSFSTGGPPATFQAALLSDSPEVLPDGRPRFIFDLVEWTSPKPVGTPYRSQMNPGIVRLSIVAADLTTAHSELGAVTNVSPVATLDYGEELGERQYFVACDPDGVTIEVVDRPVVPNV